MALVCIEKFLRRHGKKVLLEKHDFDRDFSDLTTRFSDMISLKKKQFFSRLLAYKMFGVSYDPDFFFTSVKN